MTEDSCKHCGACSHCDRCDHCGCCRKCGRFISAPPVTYPTYPYYPWPEPYRITWGTGTIVCGTGNQPVRVAYT